MNTETCDFFKEDLSAYVDGQLEAGRLSELSQHLVECAGCRHELDNIRSISTMFIEAIHSEVIPDLSSNIMASMPELCEIIQADLSAYIDSELPRPAAEGLEKHFKECTPCTDSYQSLVKTSTYLSNGMQLSDSINVDLWPAIKARLNEDCAAIQGELSSFIDQEVAIDRHRHITKHLLDCPSCANQHAELTDLSGLIAGHYQPKLPDDFDLWPKIKTEMKIVPFIPRQKAKTTIIDNIRQMPRVAIAASAMAVVLAGTLGFWFSSMNGPVIRPVSAEAYLIESTLLEPSNNAELVVYEDQ